MTRLPHFKLMLIKVDQITIEKEVRNDKVRRIKQLCNTRSRTVVCKNPYVIAFQARDNITTKYQLKVGVCVLTSLPPIYG